MTGAFESSRPAPMRVRAGPEEIKASQLLRLSIGTPSLAGRAGARGHQPFARAEPGRSACVGSSRGGGRETAVGVGHHLADTRGPGPVGLRGELDVNQPGVREHVRRYDPAEVQLAIDLTEVGLLDSAGLGGLIACERGPLGRPFAGSGLPATELPACSGRRACARPSCSGRTWRCFGLRLRTRSGDRESRDGGSG